jgi:hypothetical protein
MSDTDKPPLFFAKSLGSLRPATRAAELAVKAIPEGAQVRVRITRTTANQRRRAFYWVMLDVAAQALQDATDTPMDAELLHAILKQKLELGAWITLPSGERVFKPASTSDRAMPENERARWTDRCANVLSHWLRVPVETLMDEARAKEGGTRL